MTDGHPDFTQLDDGTYLVKTENGLNMAKYHYTDNKGVEYESESLPRHITFPVIVKFGSSVTTAYEIVMFEGKVTTTYQKPQDYVAELNGILQRLSQMIK